MADPSIITYSIRPPFAYLILNRPDQANAMNDAMVTALHAALADIATHADQVRAIVLSGADGIFSAGSTDEYITDVAAYDALLTAIRAAPQAVIARVEGTVMGGGLGLICAADIVVAAAEARFGLLDVRMGLTPALIAPYLNACVGASRARELMLTGRVFDGVSAHEYGLVQIVCPADSLNRVMAALLDELRLSNPAAIAATKAMLARIDGQPASATSAERTRFIDAAWSSPDARAGQEAYEQGRPAPWVV